MGIIMAAHLGIENLPVAPFNDGGRGTYSVDKAVTDDVELARRVLNDPRWPISPDLRRRTVEWLELLMETTDDERVRMNAIKALVAADKLNLEQAKLMLHCETAKNKLPPVNVTVNTGDTIVNTVFNRIDALESAFLGAAERSSPSTPESPSEGTVPGDGSRKPVDT